MGRRGRGKCRNIWQPILIVVRSRNGAVDEGGTPSGFDG